MHRIRRGLFGSVFDHPHLQFFTAEVGEGGGDTTEPSAGPGGQEGEEAPTEEGDEPLGEPGIKALLREREAAKAERELRREKEKQIEELNKRIKRSKLSNLEQAEESVREYQEAAERSAVEALRWRAAAKFGINEGDVEVFLTGADEETITRQAERLSALAQKPPVPKPDPTQGARGTSKPPTTAEQFADQLSDF